jgi:hypothetical protein
LNSNQVAQRRNSVKRRKNSKSQDFNESVPMVENKGLSDHIKSYIKQNSGEPYSSNSKTYIPQRMKVNRKTQKTHSIQPRSQ